MTEHLGPNDLFCANCGRTGSRGFSLRHGDGRTPQTGDWQCTNRDACKRRQLAKAYKQVQVTAVISHYSASVHCPVDGCGWFAGCNRDSHHAARTTAEAALANHIEVEHG